jgi:glycosyltransferase involved in cell wall biosynthesis
MMLSSNRKPRLLFVSHEFRFPTATGAQLRASNLIRLYSERYSVYLVVPQFTPIDEDRLRDFYDRFVVHVETVERPGHKQNVSMLKYLVGPRSVVDFCAAGYESAIERLVSRNGVFDILHLERWFMSDIVCNDIRARTWAHKYVLDQDASDYEFRRRAARGCAELSLRRAKLALEPYRVRLWERRHLKRFDCVFVSSKTELTNLKKRVKTENLLLIRNGFDVPNMPVPDVSGEKNILFVGSLNYLPNREAFDFFVAEVWPDVMARHPDAAFWHVGNAPEDVRGRFDNVLGLMFFGVVEDLRSIYERSAIAIAPLFQGSGTRIKLLEAAAHRKAMVSTRFAALDIGFVEGVSIEFADTREEMIATCIELLDDPQKRRALGINACQHVAANHSWTAISEDMWKGLETLLY